MVLWFLHCSFSSASSPLKGFTKQTASSKWNLNLNFELWAFLPREIFHQERQLYTLADAHTQAQRETPLSIHVNTHGCVCVCTHKQLQEIFIFSTSWAHFFVTKHRPSILCALTVDIVCPWPKSQDESYGRPFNFLVCSPGQNNNCSSRWTCQASRRSRQNQECSTEANKAATISCLSHQSLRYDYGREKYRQKEKVLLNGDPGDLWTCLHWFNSPDGQTFIQQRSWRSTFHCHWVKSIKTDLVLLVELISGD